MATRKPEVDSGATEDVATQVTYKVVGVLAVVRLTSGRLRDFYKDSVIPFGVADQASIEHLLSVGLIAENE